MSILIYDKAKQVAIFTERPTDPQLEALSAFEKMTVSFNGINIPRGLISVTEIKISDILGNCDLTNKLSSKVVTLRDLQNLPSSDSVLNSLDHGQALHLRSFMDQVQIRFRDELPYRDSSN